MKIPPRYLLYGSHALSRWGDRMWGFAVGIFLIHLHPQSLLVTAVYSFVVHLFGVGLSGAIGRRIDSLQRLTTMRASLLVQNTSLAAAATIIVLAFQLNISYYCDQRLFFVFMVLVTILGILSSLSSSANKMIIERDWIVVLSRNDPDLLANINAGMRRIDQVCMLLAPILSGALITAVDPSWGAGLIAVWNIISFFFEYSLLMAVYSRVPELAHKTTPEEEEAPKKSEKNKSTNCLFRSVISYLRNFKIYLSQSVALIGICLSLVYLTVLGFSSITVAFLRLNNVKDLYVGIAMASGALFGILGTLVYAPFTKRFGVSAAGALGAVFLALSYGICLGSTAYPKSYMEVIPVPNVTAGACDMASSADPLEIRGPIADPIIMLLVGVTCIRFGLWILDLAISQSFQMVVPEHQRNTVGGVQTSLNAAFECTYIVLTAAMPGPDQMDILITISCVACIGSCILYLGWYLKTGGVAENGGKHITVSRNSTAGEQVVSTGEPEIEGNTDNFSDIQKDTDEEASNLALSASTSI